MLLRETGFTFAGLHSRNDMGLIYAEKDGHIAIPEIKRSSYQIAGASGTVLMDGEAWQTFNFEGTLYPAEERATQAQAQKLLRAVSMWLTCGRQKLIFDYEPGVYYLAELGAASKWSLRNWFGGELPIRFTAQPFAYNVEATAVSRTVTSGGSQSFSLNLETGRPAPLRLTVEVTGSAPLTVVTVGGIRLAGMSVSSGSTLTIDCDPPVGATIGSASALPYATAFAPVLLGSGANTVTVGLTFGSGTVRAKVTVSARGRW